VLSNPGADEARVELRVVTEDASFVPQGQEEIRVSPESVETITLTETLRSQIREGALALQVTSTAPVTAALRSVVGDVLVHAPSVIGTDAPMTALVPVGEAQLVLARAGGAGVAVVAAYADGRLLEEKRVELAWKGASLPMLLEGFHVPGFSTKDLDLAALDVLAELLFAERAPLYKKLVITEQKVETISGSADAHVDPNLFTVLARVKKPADLGYVEKAIHDELARVGREGVDAKTLAQVQSHVKYNFANHLSTADRTASTAAQFIALTGNVASINQYFALYDKVTSADVKRVAQKYFVPEGRMVMRIMPRGGVVEK